MKSAGAKPSKKHIYLGHRGHFFLQNVHILPLAERLLGGPQTIISGISVFLKIISTFELNVYLIGFYISTAEAELFKNSLVGGKEGGSSLERRSPEWGVVATLHWTHSYVRAANASQRVHNMYKG